MAFYARFGGTFTPGEEFPCHDALAVMAAAIPGLVHGPVLPTAVQATPGPAWGMTVADRRQPHFVRAGQHQALPDGFWPCEVGLVVDHAALPDRGAGAARRGVTGPDPSPVVQLTKTAMIPPSRRPAPRPAVTSSGLCAPM